MKSEPFSAKILTLIFSAALRAALPPATQRSGGAGRKRGTGKRNARPALAFAAAEFCFLLRKKRRKKRCCPCPSRPYAGKNKEPPSILLLEF